MSECKHTPGPWEVEHNCTCLVHAHGFEIATVESDSDARLIAAAPDLLEALERIKNQFQFMACTPSEMFPDDWPFVEAAIAKATGKEGA